MARKNGNGEGSRPRERTDGRWEARYWVGGKRRSVYGSTRKEAADKLAKSITNNEEPRAPFVATNITVQEFFAQYDDAVRDTMKRRSLETYRDIARLHLLPAFGGKKLKDLSREHVQRLYSRKRDASLSAARALKGSYYAVFSGPLQIPYLCEERRPTLAEAISRGCTS